MIKLTLAIFACFIIIPSAFSFDQLIEKAAQNATVGIASIKSRQNIFCSGVLIRQNIILTAAHCVSSFTKNDLSWVVFGLNTRPSGTISKILSIKIHPNYEGTGLKPIGGMKALLGRKNDLAIVKIQKAPSTYIPIKLKLDFKELNNTSLLSVGWGAKNQFNKQKKHLINSYYKSDYLDSSYEFKSIYESSNYACNGDSGGPVFTNTNGHIQLVGLMFNLGNFGFISCKNMDSVRSIELNHYKNWINQNIEKWTH